MINNSQSDLIKVGGVTLPIRKNSDRKEYYTKIINFIEAELTETEQQLRLKNVSVSTLQLAMLVNMKITEKYFALAGRHKKVLDAYKDDISAMSSELMEISSFIDTHISQAN